MSENIKQLYDANPTTSFQSDDLMYLGRSPYTTNDDFGFTYQSFQEALFPLTTKGDLLTFSTGVDRLPVGTVNGQILQVDSSAPTGLIWSTISYPSTSTINQLLYSSADNVITGIAAASNGILITNNTGVPSISSTLPINVQSDITSLGTITSGIWNGTEIGLNYGGTNADLSSTGGASQVLRQSTVGGSITVSQLSASNLSNGTTGSGGSVVLANSPTINQPNIVGTTTNNNASPGSVGECISSSVLIGSAVSLTSNVTTNITSITLTSGDWEVSASGWSVVGSLTQTQSFFVGVSTVSATLPLPGSGNNQSGLGDSAENPSAFFSVSTGTTRITVPSSTTTTVYLVANSIFTISTTAAYGYIQAIRQR